MSNLTLANSPLPSRPLIARVAPYVVASLALVALGTWLLNTPPGLLGKADAIAFAICHRLVSHSFLIGNRAMPLCARCTGIYLGALVGLFAMAGMGRRRAGGLPRRPLLLVLLAFIGIMGVDGINSYATLLPGLPHLYQPQNWLRLVTGTLNGLALAALIYPVLNQTLWRDWEDRPVLGRFRELGLLLVLSSVVVALVLTGDTAVLVPLALLSVLGVVALLVALNTTVLLLAIRRENRVTNWAGALTPLLAGFTMTMIEIGLIDLVRFSIFHTWSGFGLLN
jgi:uncharacterized membrane protein